MERAFLFEGLGIGDLAVFYRYFAQDFTFRELSISLSRRLGVNIPAALLRPDRKDIWLYNQLYTCMCDILLCQWLRSNHVKPDLVAGHSLGVYPALHAAGAISIPAALDLVSGIHALLKRMSKETFVSCVVVAQSLEILRKTILAKSQADKPVYVATINTAKQAVITGPKQDVAAIFSYFHDSSELAAKTISLPYPVHTPYIAPLKAELRALIASTPIQTANIPIISTLDQQAITHADDVRVFILQHLYTPVHWLNTVQTLKHRAAFFDIGMRYYIAKLMFWIDKKSKCHIMKQILANNFERI